MPSAGLLCESSLGWRSIYYLFGTITVTFYLLFAFFYRDSPESHRLVFHQFITFLSFILSLIRNVSDQELKKIRFGKESQIRQIQTSVKFRRIFMNWEVVEITVAVNGLL